ncbi:MAG: disulfide bond corrector protein DsbC, partial [Planctomycetota bacterium]
MPTPMTAPLRALWRALFVLAALLPAARIAAQENEKVTIETRIVPAQVAPGGTATLEVVLTIADTFHVYGAKDPVGPTTLKLAKAAGIEAVGAAVVPDGTPHEAYGTTNYWLESSVVLQQKVRVLPGTAAGKLTLAAQLDYMVCDEDSCDPPASVTVSASLDVTAQEPGAEQPAAVPPAKPAMGGFAGALGLGGGDDKLRIDAKFVPAAARAGEQVVLRLECEA